MGIGAAALQGNVLLYTCDFIKMFSYGWAEQGALGAGAYARGCG